MPLTTPKKWPRNFYKPASGNSGAVQVAYEVHRKTLDYAYAPTFRLSALQHFLFVVHDKIQLIKTLHVISTNPSDTECIAQPAKQPRY
jgi:hypothetical protein